MLQVKKDGHMKKRKLGDLVSGGGSSSSDECTEAQVSSVVCSSSLIFYSVLKAIELARTLKPDDAMRVRANDVKVAPPELCYAKKPCVCEPCSLLTILFRAQSFGLH